MTKHDSAFPANIMRYSALRYLQKRVTERCSALPSHFNSLDEWQSYRSSLISFLKEKLPVWKTDPSPSSLTACSPLHDDLMLEAVDVHWDEGFYIPVHIYRPRQIAGHLPAVIVCPGYGQAKNEGNIVDMCTALARAGNLAVAMEYDALGERADRPDYATNIDNNVAVGLLVGITNIGLRVMSNLAVHAYLKTRSDTDSARIGITGLCQGAIASWYTSAVCNEFAAVAPLCGVTTYEAIALEYSNRQGGWSGASPYLPGLLEYADIQHIVAATAPRPLFVQNNIIDIHWPLSGFEKARLLCENVYSLYNAEENCRFAIEHGPHAYAEPFVSNIVNWFAEVWAK